MRRVVQRGFSKV